MVGIIGNSARKVPWYAVALVVVGGAIWVLLAALYVVPHLSCFSCGSLFGTSGSGGGIAGYPPQAARDLAWADVFVSLFIATGGILAIAIGLVPFRRGQKWAWYAILVFAVAGILNALLDYFEWGGWLTIFPFALFPTLGLLLSLRTVFMREPQSSVPTSETS